MNIDNEWRAHYEGILENIKKNGRFIPAYKHSKPKRVWSIFNFAVCSATCCAPCCIYDILCCSTEKCCGQPCCPYGMYCLFGHTIVSNIYERNNRIRPHTKFDISRETVVDVCKKYLIEFDMCLIQRTAKAACVANEIREYLVFIIREYLDHPTLTDNGDINKLRVLIN